MVLAGLVAVVIAQHYLPEAGEAGAQSASSEVDVIEPRSTPRTEGADDVQVVDQRVTVPGYDRSCSPGDGCVFGPAWSDDVTVEGGRDGCDTRNGILRRDLEQVELKEGTHGCVVLSGVLTDPYTGQVLHFDRGSTSGQMHVDHVFPIASAWDHGAWVWDEQRRRDFANDPRNLVATAAAVNQSKGDKMPGQWAPEANGCQYAATMLEVTLAYDLTLTQDDLDAIVVTLQGC